MTTTERLRNGIVEVYDAHRGASEGRQIDVVFPDSPYAREGLTQAEIESAVGGLPYVHGFGRFYATSAIPFDGWVITLRHPEDMI